MCIGVSGEYAHGCRCLRRPEASDSLKLELGVAVSQLAWVLDGLGLGLELRSSGRAVHAFNHWAVSPAPTIHIFNPSWLRDLSGWEEPDTTVTLGRPRLCGNRQLFRSISCSPQQLINLWIVTIIRQKTWRWSRVSETAPQSTCLGQFSSVNFNLYLTSVIRKKFQVC